jgi:ribosomal protein L37AE/L43A
LGIRYINGYLKHLFFVKIKRRNTLFLILKIKYAKKKRRICPFCNSGDTIKRGKTRGIQRYFCNECNSFFKNKRRHRNILIKYLWKDYVFGKQTLRELKESCDLDKRTIRSLLNHYQPPKKKHNPRPVHIVVDATYFGERKEETSWCVGVIRDPIKKENLVWRFTDTETTSLYTNLREQLEEQGYTILSVTADGFLGIPSAFSGIPYQMCHVHMERLVIRGTTRKPLLEPGQILLALVRTLHNTDSNTWNRRLDNYVKKYRDFLNEKTTNPLTGERCWTHEKLRMALMSLLRYRKYLFTYEQNKNIPQTTNSIEGHFSHIKDIIHIHRGLSRPHKERILNTILLASTVAPTKDILDKIL